MNILNQQRLLQEQTRFYDNVRPRHANPTFMSSNVGTSLGTSMYRSQSVNTLGIRNLSSVNTPNDQKYTPRQTQTMGKSNVFSQHRKSQSNLFNYGMSSLAPIKKQISDKDVYEKQSKQYNIVTIQPKQYVDSIKVFPKFRLQNSDQSYYRKLLAQTQMGLKNKSAQQTKIMQQALDKKLEVNPQKPQGSQIPIKNFRAKFLNNVDQLNGIL